MLPLAPAPPFAPVAQGIEHPPPKRGAASSILAGRATLHSLQSTIAAGTAVASQRIRTLRTQNSRSESELNRLNQLRDQTRRSDALQARTAALLDELHELQQRISAFLDNRGRTNLLRFSRRAPKDKKHIA